MDRKVISEPHPSRAGRKGKAVDPPFRHAGSRLWTAFESAMLWICCMTIGLDAYAAGAGESLEYAVKAAYLYKFGAYVEWPSSSFAGTTTPINLCIAGTDPFGTELDAAVSDQKVGGRPIAIRRMKSISRDSGCHIVYLGMGDMHEAGRNLEATRGNGVLTVSDIPGIGIINFVIQNDRVRFDIDEEAASQNGLKISSKLLGLAVNVRPRQTRVGQ